jgi:hypothetical protein
MNSCATCKTPLSDDTLVCPVCGTPVTTLQPAPKKWYFKTGPIIIAFLAFGPFALPLVWFNPGIRTANKVLITVLTIAATILVSVALTKSIISISTYYSTLSTL